MKFLKMRSDDYMLTAEEIRQRTRKRRNLFTLGITVALLFVLGFFLARPTAHAIKAFQARRHAQKAFAFLEQQKWSDARDEAVAAYQLQPSEPQALRAVARYLSRTRQQQALEFWDQLEKQQKLSREDRRDEATIALVSGDAERAGKSIVRLVTNGRRDAAPVDWLLAAELALQTGKSNDAQSALQRIFHNAKANEREILQAALLELRIAGSSEEQPDEQRRADAWSRITKLVQGRNDTSLDALVLVARKLLSSPAGVDHPAMMKHVDLIRALQNHPLAKAAHKLIALDLQTHHDPATKDECIARGLEEFKGADASSLVSLATWLNGHAEFEKTLDAIPIEKALQTRELLLQYLDALGALARWEEIRKILESEKYPFDPVIQRMYLARCYGQLGQKTASENNWQRALEAARNDVPKLLTLAEYAEKNGALEIAEIAYNSAAAETPKLRVAQGGRLRIAQASRDTKKIHALLVDMLNVWPSDTAIQNDEAYLRLISLPNDAPNNQELIEIERLAAELLKREPASLPHRTLLALARLKQGRPVAALDVYANIQVAPNALSPSALAVHAAVLAANNQKDDARTEMAQVPFEKLLPEEQAGTADLRE